MAGQNGRPSHANTIAAIPEGPMPTNKAKWAAIAKWHAVNSEREKAGYKEITLVEFVERTQINETDIYNAGAHKEYIEAAMSLAKGQSTMWFRNELQFMQESAKKLRDDGEDKEYLKVVMELASMLKFKDVDLSGMEDSESKTAKETVEEVLNLLSDDAVQNALNNEDGFVAQKIIPAIINANFKLGAKAKTPTVTRTDMPVEVNVISRPDQSVDTVSETENRPI